MIETAKIDPTLKAITSYEIAIEHPCKAISLSPFVMNDQDSMIGDELGLDVNIPDATISPADMVSRCPILRHTYSHSLLCGEIDSSWLTLDSDKHLISIITPETIDQQGQKIKVKPAVVSVEVLQ